jgi:hypothetical protein
MDYEKTLHGFFLSIVFTLLNWVFVDNLIVSMNFWQYVAIEIVILVSYKLYQFIFNKISKQ